MKEGCNYLFNFSLVIEPLAFHNLPEQLAKSMTAHFLERKKGGRNSQNEAPFLAGRKVFYSSPAARLKSESSPASDTNETRPKRWQLEPPEQADDWLRIQMNNKFDNDDEMRPKQLRSEPWQANNRLRIQMNNEFENVDKTRPKRLQSEPWPGNDWLRIQMNNLFKNDNKTLPKWLQSEPPEQTNDWLRKEMKSDIENVD